MHNVFSDPWFRRLSGKEGADVLREAAWSWAGSQGLTKKRYVPVGPTGRAESETVVDAVIGGMLAIEFDSRDNLSSLATLEQVQAHGYQAIWVRWKTPVQLAVPRGIQLILPANLSGQIPASLAAAVTRPRLSGVPH